MTSGALLAEYRELSLRRLKDANNMAMLCGLHTELDQVAALFLKIIFTRRGPDCAHFLPERSWVRSAYQAGAAVAVSISVPAAGRFALTHSASSLWLAFLSRSVRISSNSFRGMPPSLAENIGSV